jgi:hypothetical protein
LLLLQGKIEDKKRLPADFSCTTERDEELLRFQLYAERIIIPDMRSSAFNLRG